MSGGSSGISPSWQARYFSPAAKAPVQAPRPAEDLRSQQKTIAKTPERPHRTPKRGAGWAHHSRGWSRSEVTRLGREVGRGALYTVCKFLLRIGKAGVLKDAFRKNAPLRPKMHLLEENTEVEGRGASLLDLGG